MLNTAVFVSGNGSNLQAIIDSNKLNVLLVVCNNKEAYAIERAKASNIEILILDYYNVSSLYNEIMVYEVMKEMKIELILLAGFLKKITPYLICKYPNRIINIHPSLLPKYKGLNAIERAIENNEDEIGVTVHYVNERIDDGEIIVQGVVNIKHLEQEDIYNTVHKLEHKLYLEAIDRILEEKNE